MSGSFLEHYYCGDYNDGNYDSHYNPQYGERFRYTEIRHSRATRVAYNVLSIDS